MNFNAVKGSLVLCIGLSNVSVGAQPNEDATELSWYPRALLSEEQQASLPSFCRGMYLPPELPSIAGEQIELEANSSSSDASGGVYFRGNVEFARQGQRLRADEADWFRDQGEGEFRGNVQFDSTNLVLAGEQATLSQDKGTRHTDLFGARYALTDQHLRGSADHIRLQADGKLQLQQASFTYCEPGSNDWEIRASSMTLDQQSGMGSAWHTRLNLGGVPVVYLPYYRFPIDDRRMTGFLNPQLSLNQELQAEEIRLPFYLSLADNVDATITPHHILDRGLLWESQLRHKTELLGDGELNYGYLNQDATDDAERWGINYRQSGAFGQGWSHSWVYNNVSDGDYLKDMNPGGAIDRTTHLPRRGQVSYQQQDLTFSAIAESFQTLDDSILLKNRPYRRLPQLELSYQPVRFNDWQWQQRLQYSQFTRDDDASIAGSLQTLTGADALNAHRWAADTAVSYPLYWSYASIEPKAEWRYRHYRFSGPEQQWLDSAQAPDRHLSYAVPRYSLDASLFFERPFEWFGKQQLQTLEPRLLWVKSPYRKDQQAVPNFDTAATTVSYASLFSGDRFTGDDRLADLDQISLGITSRWLNERGEERLRGSIGRIFYQQDRRIQLTGDMAEDSDTSSTLAEWQWMPTDALRIYNTLEWDPYQDFFRQQRLGIRFRPDSNRLINVAWNTDRRFDSDNDRIQTNNRQLDVGVFWSINDRWALVGRLLRDLKDYDDDELRPLNPVLESIAGLEYQNCCWRAQLLYRESSPSSDDFSDGFSTDKKYSFMLNLQLKGLGSFGSGTDDLLSDSIFGYSRRQYHDY